MGIEPHLCRKVPIGHTSFNIQTAALISLMANSLIFNSADHYVLQNLSMIAYVIEMKYLPIFNFVNLTNLSQVAKFKYSVYFHSVRYMQHHKIVNRLRQHSKYQTTSLHIIRKQQYYFCCQSNIEGVV